ncbi:unnamed protein product [Penicillium salamii]|uniref:F-box domain-containing protein n=1 Tax=Penicillium salamii TaxID=1612424 RepID=A0A9W4IMK9_9EURO|nr:unnamed protein product [Penicillium salamii]CAG7952868.1 unnamed protein product [Penicillium salamii]CAG7986562.1 unnamed protein product [Penicillium salamii]CAG8029267.1 unnamed protein product [Penicillium salamii]CAG8117176.1 unnamed protein product [Penicillium salamii]
MDQAECNTIAKCSYCSSCRGYFLPCKDWGRKYKAVCLTRKGIRVFDVSEEVRDRIVVELPGNALLFHTGCWLLLTKQFGNETIDFRRLIEVARDEPCPENHPPALLRDVELKAISYDGKEEPICLLKRPRLRHIGDATRKLRSIQRSRTLYRNLTSSIDGFSMLPVEIRLEIASYLSTPDFFTLRTVSRGMAAIFSLQSFWRTKFLINGDRGFLSYLTEKSHDQRKTNWRSMYRCTARCDTFDRFLQALLEIWRLNRWLVDRCSMVQRLDDQSESDLQLEVSGQISWEVAPPETHRDRWPRRAYSLNCPFCPLSHAPVTQFASLKEIISLVVFVLYVPPQNREKRTRTWITGIDLISANAEKTITIGYRVPRSYVTLNLYQQRLRGFQICAGGGGIRAVRPIMDRKSVEDWIGQPASCDGAFRYKLNHSRNARWGEIKAISAKFDVSRIFKVYLATSK